MAIYEITGSALVPLQKTAFSDEGMFERRDLQRLLREQIEVIARDTMVLAEEFGDFEDSRRRIDLLCLDSEANLVVVELKRTETGGHMDLQAIRYAAMVSTMTFDRAVSAHESYLTAIGKDPTGARAEILEFLGWDEPSPDEFAAAVRIVLAASEFSKELTTAVIWLNENGLDIRCVRLSPSKLDDRLLVDIQQVIPMPEASEYQVRLREQNQERREARQFSIDFTKYDLKIGTQESTGLTKRELVYRVGREAVDRGFAPEDIGRPITWKRARLWAAVEGSITEEEKFIAAAEASALSNGGSFNTRRYFTASDHLIPHKGRTYAFSNQWGHDALRTVDTIIKHIGASDISYKPSGQE